jgi:hypothetical protein
VPVAVVVHAVATLVNLALALRDDALAWITVAGGVAIAVSGVAITVSRVAITIAVAITVAVSGNSGLGLVLVGGVVLGAGEDEQQGNGETREPTLASHARWTEGASKITNAPEIS